MDDTLTTPFMVDRLRSSPHFRMRPKSVRPGSSSRDANRHVWFAKPSNKCALLAPAPAWVSTNEVQAWKNAEKRAKCIPH